MSWATHEHDARLAQIGLPAGRARSLPWGFPTNVWLLRGDNPAVVDTGPPGTADALRGALTELGVSPRHVTRVVLTSLRPEAIGNLEVFENASIISTAPASVTRDLRAHLAPLRARHERLVRDLCAWDGRSPAWSLDEALETLSGTFEVPAQAGASLLADRGTPVVAGGRRLEVVPTPGIDEYAATWFEPDSSTLFGGQTVVVATDTPVEDAPVAIESLLRVSQLAPARIAPGQGGIERSYQAVFRSLNLRVNNLLQNVPFALRGPTPLAEIVATDLGRVPRDVVRFAATVRRYEAMLDELVRSGVSERTGEGAMAVYSMERRSRAGQWLPGAR
jgi:glyoxylase-like metal-dependent hydrolase (beta-lactamase superfamily II)